MSKIVTSEFVSSGHPDKIADQISDALLDEYLRQDPNSRCGIETLIKDNVVVLGGEVNSKAIVNHDDIVKKVIDNLHFPSSHNLDGEHIKVINLIGKQSEEIHSGVDKSSEEIGAGDQGFMVGYASNETALYLPLGVYLAKIICQYISSQREQTLGPDTKAQVVVEYTSKGNATVKSILVSTMHQNTLDEVRAIVKDMIISNQVGIEDSLFTKYDIVNVPIDVNPCGEWKMGGPISDCGVTGRKIVVDQFGGYCQVGGGALSGKDMTKVDRSAAYMCRYLAKNIVAAKLADTAKVELAYTIGVATPTALNIELTNAKVKINALKEWIITNVDLTPKGIMDKFHGIHPQFYITAVNGHYGFNGYKAIYSWEKTDLVEALQQHFNAS